MSWCVLDTNTPMLRAIVPGGHGVGGADDGFPPLDWSAPLPADTFGLRLPVRLSVRGRPAVPWSDRGHPAEPSRASRGGSLVRAPDHLPVARGSAETRLRHRIALIRRLPDKFDRLAVALGY